MDVMSCVRFVSIQSLGVTLSEMRILLATNTVEILKCLAFLIVDYSIWMWDYLIHLDACVILCLHLCR